MTTERKSATTKSRLMKALETLPEDASREEVLECVALIVDLERAAEEIAAGKTISHEEALARIHQWLK
jgi:hypothetical protein